MVSYLDDNNGAIDDGTPNEAIAQRFTRRNVLKAGAAAAAISATGVPLAQAALAQESGSATAVADGSVAATSCVLTPELTEGPYYLDDVLIRQEITEGKPGLPLRLRIAVSNPTTCTPLANAAVEIWHCDSHGYYSGIEGNNPGPDADQETIAEAADETFLRGVQITDDSGIAEFQTIYPGWYISRTIHIHMKVIVDGDAGTTYEGGHVAHTGQLFFDDAITAQVLQIEPYAGRPDESRTTNDEDNVLGDHDDEDGFFVTLTPLTEGTIEDGFLAEIAIGVDPEASPAEADTGGGGGPGGAGQGGQPPSGGGSGTPPQDED